MCLLLGLVVSTMWLYSNKHCTLDEPDQTIDLVLKVKTEVGANIS